MTIAQEDVLHHHDDDVSIEYSTLDSRLKILGFWLFLTSDLILFGSLFSVYVVLRSHTAGGPTPEQLFDVRVFTEETIILLTSSFTCGLATREMRRKNRAGVGAWLIITVVLGLAFVSLEVNEFVKYATTGAPIERSAFLSAFFTLVGTHGCHVSMGILWMLSILFQVLRFGITDITARKVFIVGLYWHFLDIVWVYIFTVVYLMGVMK